MKKLHQLLQIVLLVYFGGFLIFFISFTTLGGVFGMDEITSDGMVTIFLIGAILFLISWAAGSMTVKGMTDQMNKKEVEMNNLKAKLYDSEHPNLPPAKDPFPRITKPGDPDQSNIVKRQNITD